ncbi:hypothetical protein PAT3040_03233 [Paenibacillus agaridevorans]|uniref:Copper amine oxidase-like N-terminal domain-containing protein n=1 Tax=Paenibacillus agaridevorans TaxID=171404 RepID=A0A2R5ER93_9BACL|nr:copper amine oxidase N-terminal domain-containing protein [Paenibacillus agaridevorans]GBG08645.1 hypothetical protein PAT3040_03233 [Paenibacillus agaridevorans]
MKETLLKRRKTITLIIALLWISAMLFPGAAFSAERTVEVYVNGKSLTFGDASPIIQDGRTFVPFRAIFEALGYTVTWDGEEQIASGEKDGFKIELTINSFIARVGSEETALDAPAKMIGGNTLVPLRFVSEHSGYDVVYMSTQNTFAIGIYDQYDMDPIPLRAEPRQIVGRVTDERGSAEPGIPVIAVNTGSTDTEASGLSSEYGYYSIELPLSTKGDNWTLSPTYEIQYHGKSYIGDLHADLSGPVDSLEGGIRTLTAAPITGTLFMEVDASGQSLWNPSDIVITLSSKGPLLDGTEGETIVKRASELTGGIGVPLLPIGNYEVTAHYMPNGAIPVALQLRLSSSDELYEGAVTPRFQESAEGDYYLGIEVKLND